MIAIPQCACARGYSTHFCQFVNQSVSQSVSQTVSQSIIHSTVDLEDGSSSTFKSKILVRATAPTFNHVTVFSSPIIADFCARKVFLVSLLVLLLHRTCSYEAKQKDNFAC